MLQHYAVVVVPFELCGFFYLNKLCNALFVTTKLKKFDSTNVVF